MLLIPLLLVPPLTVHGLFSDNMVIQRDEPITMWGTAAVGQRISVKLGPDTGNTLTVDDMTWSVTLKPIHDPGPYTLTVDGGQHIEFHNVAVGEVWVCAGQSNIEFTLAGVLNADAEIADATDPNIRLYKAPQRTVDVPLHDVDAKWETCTPRVARDFSAVGYFFGRGISRALHVPVGIIETAWGGTPAEAWTPRSALVGDPTLAHIMTDYEAHKHDSERAMEQYQRDLAAYNNQTTLNDSGNDGFDHGYADPAFDDSVWSDAPVPGEWGAALHLNFVGGAWYRKTLEIPASWSGKDLMVALGQIDDFDTVYFNGKQVGTTTQNDQWWARLRHYSIPSELVRPGKNLIAVRVWDRNGPGGFLGGEPIQISAPGAQPISLEGTWRFLIEKGSHFAAGFHQPPMPLGPGNPAVPASLWNGMVACLPPFGVRGVIWYQGESNADRAYQYRRLFPALIKGWRQQFGQGDIPFYFVQLANYLPRDPQPEESAWAELREAQAMSLSLPNTGMATAIDVGAANDIHPKNKQQVARRLVLLALNRTYGKPQEDSGPTFQRFTINGSSVRLTFDHTTGGLVVQGASLDGFAIAGADRKFHWAKATIDGASVIVSSPDVPTPVAVRYGWANNPTISLYNGAGLPAPPFRTDEWPGVTAGRL
jgi:sialate O-acetylesterase